VAIRDSLIVSKIDDKKSISNPMGEKENYKKDLYKVVVISVSDELREKEGISVTDALIVEGWSLYPLGKELYVVDFGSVLAKVVN
jgi:hypothetical protein